jgi:hypothetical protein
MRTVCASGSQLGVGRGRRCYEAIPEKTETGKPVSSGGHHGGDYAPLAPGAGKRLERRRAPSHAATAPKCSISYPLALPFKINNLRGNRWSQPCAPLVQILVDPYARETAHSIPITTFAAARLFSRVAIITLPHYQSKRLPCSVRSVRSDDLDRVCSRCYRGCCWRGRRLR